MKHVHVLELPLLGVALEFVTADARITNALTQVYGHWRDWEFLNAITTRPDPLPRIRLALAGTPTCNAPPSAPRIQLSGDHIRMRGTHVRGTADLLHYTGHAVLSPALLADLERFRADAIDTLALAILTRLDRTPVHGSAIANKTTMLVFAGPSGIGKSTLAHLGQQAGYEVIADEAVYVQTEPVTRIWGFARTPRPRPFGSVSREKRAPATRVNRAVTPFRERAALCVLRRDGPPEGALEPVSLDEAAAELSSQLDPGFDQFREVLPAVVRALATDGAWRFFLPAKPHDAVPFFQERLGPPSGPIS